MKGELERAVELYGRSLELDPESVNAKRMIAWIALAREAAAQSPQLSAAELAALAGDYGPRHVRYENGKLSYQREGRDRGYELTPLTRETFALVGLPTFRLRFEAGKVVGLYADGREEESPRD